MSSTSISYKVIVRPHILIVKLGARGDVLRTTSILPPLAEKHPGAEIYWLVGEDSREILEGNPYLSGVITDLSGFEGKFDRVLSLDEDKSALRAAARAGGELVGFYTDGGGVRATESFDTLWRMSLYGPSPENDRLKKSNRLTYQRLLYDALGLGTEIHRPVLEIPRKDKEMAAEFRGGYEKIAGINFSSSALWPAKRLPLSKVLNLAEMIETAGVTPVIFGSRDEKKEISILRESGGKLLFACGMPLKRFAAVIGECEFIITTDSLALHIATAGGKRVASLFGPTSAAEAEIYGNGVKVSAPVDCLCCYRKKCSRKPFCMDMINLKSALDSVIKTGNKSR